MISSAEYTIPRYLQIAVDLAARVASGGIAEGDKLKGRSVLASEYNVSPETIRKAMSILSDRSVVSILQGSGILILSKERAIEFVNSFRSDESAAKLRRELSRMQEMRRSLDEQIASAEKQIIELYQYKRSDWIVPVEVRLPRGSHVIGKSIGQLEVWHNTGATIIGVVQDKNIIISPGPYYEFSEGDRVLIVGDENVIGRFNAFVRGPNR